MLEGDILIEYFDQSFVKAYVKNNVIIGVQRHFKEDKSITKVVDTSTGSVLWSVQDEGYSIINCIDQRCTLSSYDMTEMKSCLKVDNDLFIGLVNHQSFSLSINASASKFYFNRKQT